MKCHPFWKDVCAVRAQPRLSICLAPFWIQSELGDKRGREAPTKQAIKLKSDQLLNASGMVTEGAQAGGEDGWNRETAQ